MGKATKVYWVSIKAGTGSWGPKVGWDEEFATRSDAEACAERARQNSGWEARVVEAEAATPHI